MKYFQCHFRGNKYIFKKNMFMNVKQVLYCTTWLSGYSSISSYNLGFLLCRKLEVYGRLLILDLKRNLFAAEKVREEIFLFHMSHPGKLVQPN